MSLKCRRNGIADRRSSARLAGAAFDVGDHCRLDLAGRRGVAKVVGRSTAERMAAVGSAFCCPAISGAEPWTGSNMDGAVRSMLMLPDAAKPMPPVTAAARSVRMSPKRLSVTITSKREGSVTMKMVAASMCR